MTSVGASGKANVGISNDKGGEKPPRRKTKGRTAKPMEETVNIPLLLYGVTWRRRSESPAG